MKLAITDQALVSVWLIGLGGTIVFFVGALHIAYTKMDMMLGHLKNCPFIMNQLFLNHAGPRERLMVLGSIVSVVKAPGFYIPDGGVSIDDIANFPEPLKQRLIKIYRLGAYSAWILVLCSFIIFIDWSAMGPARLGAALLLTAAIPGWMALCVWLGKAHADTIISNFKNSSAIKSRARLNAGGRFGKLMFMIAALTVVTCEGIFVRRGTINPAELNKLPSSLKVRLSYLFWAGCMLITSLLLLYLSGMNEPAT
jgi:hypothetical protein